MKSFLEFIWLSFILGVILFLAFVAFCLVVALTLVLLIGSALVLVVISPFLGFVYIVEAFLNRVRSGANR